MPQNFYELVWLFIIYAFIGWCTEVSYAALETGKFINRGFLNGPYCPIYGCGMTIVIALLTPLKEHFMILFAGSFLLTSTLEYLTGYVLEKVFHNKWWDYSGRPFNIRGYICLKFSIFWGLACTFVMDIVHPIIYDTVTIIPFKIGAVILVILMTGFTVDVAATVTTILNFNKRIRLLDDMASRIHNISNELGENIYENVTLAVEKSEEFQENHADVIEKINDRREEIREIPENAKERLERNLVRIEELELIREAKRQEKQELLARYAELLGQKNIGFSRLMKAFPEMKATDRNETLQKYKKYFDDKNKIKKVFKK